MKQAELRKEVAKRGIDPDTVQALHNGKKISSKDYIRTLQQHSIEQRGGWNSLSWGMQRRLEIECPMLCANYKDMKPAEQTDCMESEDWLCDKKINGVRMIQTYHPDEGFKFFTRNLSVIDWMPSEYTDKVLINHCGELKAGPEFIGEWRQPFILDTEICCDNPVVDTTVYRKKGGTVTNSVLNAVNTTLSIEPDISHKIQKEQAQLISVAFDCTFFEGRDMRNKTLHVRKNALSHLYGMLSAEGIAIRTVEFTYRNKEEFYKSVIAEGGEGIVLKKTNATYCSTGKRDKVGFVKRKRTVSESLGDDIDAYIVGSHPGTPGTKNEHLVGAVDLAVMLQKEDGSEEEFGIATVGAMSDEMRKTLTIYEDGKPVLNPAYLGKVLTIDGQDISPKARRFKHARADWDRGFRDDKNSTDCTLEEEFINSQIF